MTRKFTFEEVKQYVEVVSGSGCKLLSTEYVDSKSNLVFQCICGEQFERNFNKFKSKRMVKCLNCSPVGKRKTPEKFISDIQKVHGDSITVTGLYTKDNGKVGVQCNACSHKWHPYANNLLNGSGCPNCFKVSLKKTHEQYISDLQKVHGNSITVIGDYTGSRDKTAAKCNSCSHIWNPRVKDLLKGSGCPNCASSKGEKAVESVLQNLQQNFIPQLRFPDCRNKNTLPFDFAVISPLDSESVALLIEFDGEQHYEAVEYWGGTQKLQYTQKNDQIKTDYCLAKGIPLLRIPYWEAENIEQLVTEAVNTYVTVDQNTYRNAVQQLALFS